MVGPCVRVKPHKAADCHAQTNRRLGQDSVNSCTATSSGPRELRWQRSPYLRSFRSLQHREVPSSHRIIWYLHIWGSISDSIFTSGLRSVETQIHFVRFAV